MVDSATLTGFLGVLVGAVGNGSCYVPAKRHEVHDALVFQWYQCSGVLLGAIFITACVNDWSNPSGCFYVHWEGMTSGFLWTGANVLGTLSVKFCGLGVYWLVHQITNIGGAFFWGVCGQSFGFATTPPKNIPLAAVGVALVFAGVIPVVLLKPPEEPVVEESAPAAERPSSPGLFGLHGSIQDGKVSSMVESLLIAEAPGSRDYDLRQQNSLTWDGASPLALLKSRSPKAANFLHALEAMPTMPLVLDIPETGEVATQPLEALQEAGVIQQAAPAQRSSLNPWGIFCCLLCGCFWSSVYLPSTTWQLKMKAAGHNVSGADYLFSLCLGIYASSTVWLLLVSTWKKVLGQRVEKPVLRPALCAGIVWTIGAQGILIAMEKLPYAVGYSCASGGGLMVSLLWGMLIFGEAEGRANKIRILCSFITIVLGFLCLGFSMK